MYLTQRFPIEDVSQVGEARRFASLVASDQGFDQTECGRVALVATELATNIIRYAKSGELLCNPLRLGEFAGLELLAVDKGPGIASVAQCMTDGFSSVGNSGVGLGAIQRLANDFEVHSLPGKGTVVLARLWAGVGTEEQPRLANKPQLLPAASAIALTYPGEKVSGDGYALAQVENGLQIMMADGLGHGMLAESVSRTAERVFLEHAGTTPVHLIQTLHEQLRGTRGAALALATIDTAAANLVYVGIGNINAVILDREGTSRTMVSLSGICGHEMRKVQPFNYAWNSDSTLVMHSDGLSASWQLRQYPGLLYSDPAVIAAVLYRDYCRGRDDATILVTRPRGKGSAASAQET